MARTPRTQLAMTRDPITRDGAGGVAWRPLVARGFVIVLGGEVVGFALGITAVAAAGLLTSAGFLVNVVAGAVTGVALGLLVLPRPRQLLGYATAGATLGTCSWVSCSPWVRCASEWATYHPGRGWPPRSA